MSLAKLENVIQEHRFALAAFLIPVGIRAVPEILVGPYPVGWDTIAFCDNRFLGMTEFLQP